jgi:hypothetical protein
LPSERFEQIAGTERAGQATAKIVMSLVAGALLFSAGLWVVVSSVVPPMFRKFHPIPRSGSQSIEDGLWKVWVDRFRWRGDTSTRSKVGGKTMDEPDRWRHIASAPKDGSRILVTVRPSEQGPAEVDLAYWSNGDQFGVEGWRASDSSPGRVIEYAEPELKCWMPMPSANLNRTSMPSPWEGDDAEQLDGSGI